MYVIKLKFDKETSTRRITEQIDLLRNSQDVCRINEDFKNIIKEIDAVLNSEEIKYKLKAESLYQENEYSKEKNKENILKAKDKVINFLEDIVVSINKDGSEYIDDFTEEIAIPIIRKILNNFYMHIETMYEEKVHGKAGITKDSLNKIKIINEYDVQRILYSLIKPVFPEARLEVPNDTGFSTIRYDILIEKYSIIIEVKCSRSSMTEKILVDEIAADIIHYKYKNIFFFVYDKEKIIRNYTAFENTYTGVKDSKNVETIVIQPRIL